jgi:hypothetical protein
VPLTINHHILCLLATVFTAGLFLPFWIVWAINGSKRPATSREEGRS